MVLVAEEYFYSKDYLNALTFLTNVLPHYREEGWQSLIQNILVTALQSAYLSADAINFVKLGFECISCAKRFTIEDKISIQESIHNIMRKQLPLLLSFVDRNDSETALKLWSNGMQSSLDPIVFTIKMDSYLKFIECKPTFTSSSFYCNQNIEMDIFLQSNAPNPIHFSKMNVLFSNQFYNQFCEIIDSSEEDSENNLLLMPSKLRKFRFDFNGLSEDIDRNLTIIGVNLTLGSQHMSAVMQWSFTEELKFIDFTNRCSEAKDIKQIKSQLTTKIVKPVPKLELKVSHNPPALLNEFFYIGISIKNWESFDVFNVRLNLKIFDSENEEIETICHSFIWSENQFKQLTQNFTLNDIKVNQELKETIFVRFENIESHLISASITYDSMFESGTDRKVICLSVSEKIRTDILVPFVNSFELLNLSLSKVSQIRVSEPFFLNITTKQNTEIPVQIIETIPRFHETISCLSQKDNEFKENVCVDQSFKIVGSEEHSLPISLGFYSIKWKRISDSGDMPTMISETLIPLPITSITRCPVFVDLEYPEVCVARNPVILRFNIYNRTDSDLTLELSMGTSDNFMYSGNKLVSN